MPTLSLLSLTSLLSSISEAGQRGAIAIPVGMMSDGSQIAIAAQKVEDLQKLFIGIIVSIAAFGLIELYKIIFGGTKDTSKELKELKEMFIDERRQNAQMRDIIKEVQQKMVTKDEVREIAEERIEFIARLKNGVPRG